jgi:PA14 domain.
MATRVDRTPGLDRLAESTLLRKLRLASPRRENDSNFVGLKRSSALSDIENPPKALDNILDKLSELDVAERNLYGRPFNGVDWGVTGDFIYEQIDKQFLSPLSGASIGGGSLGSQVSTSPRIRIEDRISLANSYFGEGSFPGLHSGPDAKFYRATTPEEIGYVKFSFTGSSVTVTGLRKPDKTTTLTVSEILGTETEVVLDVAGYELLEPISLSGSGIALRLVAAGSVWTIAEGASSLVSIREILGSSVFPTVFFRLTRPYSVVNLPLWFTQAPNDLSVAGPGGADDISPGTSLAVLRSEGGIAVPDVAKGYWFSREYVETRWTATERFLLGVEENDTITEDSNMRWLDVPSPLRGEQYNWGVRWDGYLRVTAGNYSFQVQTNVLVRIDMAVGSSPGYWVNVFDTRTNSAQENSDTYISSATFGTSMVDGRFKYVTGPGADDWVAYVPITIRMLRGGPDKAQPGVLVPSEPDIFIKTTSVPSELTFYSQTHTVNLVGTDGSWSITGGTLAQIIDVLEDPDASVTYRITARGSNIFTSPVSINLTTDGTVVSSTSTGFVAGSHTLVISPLRTTAFENNLTALWKGRIASPGPGQRTYADLVSGSYTPDIQKVTYDSRPDWWKTTEGNRYDRSLSSSVTNTPLDGLLRNTFKSSLQSDSPRIRLIREWVRSL